MLPERYAQKRNRTLIAKTRGAPFLASFARSGAFPFESNQVFLRGRKPPSTSSKPPSLVSPCLRASVVGSLSMEALLPPEPPHSHSHLHRIQPRIRHRQPRIRYMQIPQLHAPVIFRPQNMRPQRRRRGKVQSVRIRRNAVIREQRSPTQLEKRRQPPPPLKIPLQPQRIKPHPISHIRRLKNQISRLRIHRILKPPPQNSRQMLPRNHPPIPQPHIKDSRPRSPSRHRMPTPTPNLHLMPALFRTNFLCQSQRRDKNQESEKRNQTPPSHSHD
jgi:hypothetical protein